MSLVIPVLSVLLIVTALFTIYYWLDFYLRGGVQVIPEEWYIKFEKAFPVADLWMAACALLGAVGLLTEQTYGLLFSLLAASSLIFLALMDITFNVENRLYRLVGTSREMALELLINLWCLSFGVILIIYLWPKIALL
ncbi:MAG: hypothetical protein OEX10_03855 [Candidatus Bathyarchaeota archaeon]|nr:hypothetical protein [Candidatus Bathyarchaeota archaeon]